jgi:RNA polymerase sigma-70 factor (ECF subfamily)
MEPNSKPRTTDDTVYDELRPLLLSIAYQMVGTMSGAEDIVQETLLRFHRARAQGTEIASARAWLSTVTTRLAINHVRSARVRRETYVGTWLPEPLVTDTAPDAAQQIETADALSMAFIVLLESLSPVERAVFLLHDVFDYGYDEVAAIVGKSEDNCRQIAVRARRQIEARKPRFEASRQRREELAQRFFQAVGAGDSDDLVDLLAADVVLYADGGGKTPTVRQPVYGRQNVGRLILAFDRWLEMLGAASVHYATVNEQPGAVFFSADGRAVLVVSVDIADSLVQTINAISNPEKLHHLDANAGRSLPN